MLNARWRGTSWIFVHATATQEISSSRPAAKTSHGKEGPKIKKISPRIIGTASQSLKDRVTRSLTTRSCRTGSLIPENRLKTDRRQSDAEPKYGPNEKLHEPDSPFSILETRDHDWGQRMQQSRLEGGFGPRFFISVIQSTELSAPINLRTEHKREIASRITISI